MSNELSFLTEIGRKVIRRLLTSAFLLFLFIVGYWMLEQTMNAVVILHRDYVDVPFYGLQIDVWFYHDIAYVLIWLSYIAFFSYETTPWKRGLSTSQKVLIALPGFACLTAGLWVTQDTMNAVLSLHRTYIDFPFFALKPDVYSARDVGRMLIFIGFLLVYTLSRD